MKTDDYYPTILIAVAEIHSFFTTYDIWTYEVIRIVIICHYF